VKPTRREFLRGGLALAALASKAQAALAADPASPHTLWYTSDAKRWLEALPIGNGRVGGMVFGGVTKGMTG
jgi:alpha-L-fucosidase 2